MKERLIELVEKEGARDLGVDFKPGDTVRMHYKVVEGEKERTQIFEGVVIARNNKNFTLRKISMGVGVERIVPLHSPYIEKLEVIRRGRVRRAKLYYLRNKVGKAAKIKELQAR